MSKENPTGPPPPYPGGYSDPNNYNTVYGSNPPPPQPYAPPKYDGSYPPQPAYAAHPAYAAQPGYAAQPYGPGYTHGTAVVVNQPSVTLIQSFRESPVRTRCNHCQAEVITGTHYETGTFTWVICIVLWFIGCGFGCCLIPFCMDGCKDVLHTCPNCHQQIARYSRM